MPSKEPPVPNDDPPTEPTDDPQNVSTSDPTQESNNAFSDFDKEADANITLFEELPDIHEEVSKSEEEDNAIKLLAIRFPADVWRRRETALQNNDDKDIEAYPITYEHARKGEHAEDADTAVDEKLENMDRYNV